MKRAFSLIELSIVILIIGILVAGVTQSSRLIREFRINAARGLTQSSPVNSISGLVAWWETTSEKSFTSSEAEDEATISTWYDLNPQSTLKMDMPQSSAGNRPFYDENIINSLPAVRFNGSNRYFEKSYTAELNPNNFTIFAVSKVASLSSIGAIFSSRNGNGTMRGYILYAHATSDAPASSFNLWLGNGSNWGSSFNPISITTNQTYVVTQKYDGTTVTAYNAGNLVGSRSETNFLLNQTYNSRIGAGLNEGSPQYFFNGHIGELIIFNRVLKNEERSAIEKYLGKKWGVDIN